MVNEKLRIQTQIIDKIRHIKELLDDAELDLSKGKCPNPLGIIRGRGSELDMLVAQLELLSELEINKPL